MDAPTPTLRAARDELRRGLSGLLERELPAVAATAREGLLAAGTPASSPLVASLGLANDLRRAGRRGLPDPVAAASAGHRATVIAANTDRGVLYGAFRLLRLVQTGRPLSGLAIVDAPRVRHRVLDHWDNLDRTVERGYAGFSLWDWHKLPDYLAPALHRLRPRERLDRHQRHGAHERQRERDQPDGRVPRQGRRARRRSSARTASASTSPPASARRSRSAA